MVEKTVFREPAMTTRTFFSAAAASALLLALTACSPVAVGQPGGGTQTSPASASAPFSTAKPALVIQRYEDPTFDRTKGNPTTDMEVAANALHDFIGAHPDVFSGAWWTTDYSGFVVGIAYPQDPAAVEYEALRKELDPGLEFTRIHDAKYSLDELLARQKEIVDKYMANGVTPGTGMVIGVGPDLLHDRTAVTIVRTTGDPQLEDFKTVQEIARKYGDDVAFEESAGIGTLD